MPGTAVKKLTMTILEPKERWKNLSAHGAVVEKLTKESVVVSAAAGVDHCTNTQSMSLILDHWSQKHDYPETK